MATKLHKFPAKDPGERLSYTFDFTDLLATAELLDVLNTVIVSPATGTPLVVDAQAIDVGGKKVTVVLSGGKPGAEYTVSVNADSDTGTPVNIWERSCVVPVENR